MAAQPMSAASKKNQQKRQRKKAKERATAGQGIEPTLQEQPIAAIAQPAPPPSPPPDPVAELKRQIEAAKAEKDHELAQKLRQQLWALQDTLIIGTTGPGAPALDPSLLQQSSPQPTPTTADPAPRVMGDADVLEKKISKLQKKLKAISDLRERQARGEKLEANQLSKIETESDILDQIHTLEEELRMNQLR